MRFRLSTFSPTSRNNGFKNISHFVFSKERTEQFSMSSKYNCYSYNVNNSNMNLFSSLYD